MPNTLTRGGTTVTLPEHLLWPDELSWSPVVESPRFSVSGAFLRDYGVKQAGRQLVLRGGRRYAWITRSTLLTLQGWAADPTSAMTLAFRGTNYAVVFDRTDKAIEAEALLDYSDPAAADFYVPTLRFITTA